MTKFGDFKELVRQDISTAENALTADICYGMGALIYSSEPKNCGISLHELDDAYDELIFINRRDKDWVLYGIQESSDNIVLGTISITYERYQVARFLADLYLTFYQNFRLY